MKIAVISDIHGNLPALQAVAEDVARWRPDKIVVAGDVVNRGPLSPACWDFVLRQGWQLIGGNHEAYVVSHQASGVQVTEANRASFWTYGQFQGAVSELAALDDGCSLFAPNGAEVRIRHASMRHNRDGIRLTNPVGLLRQQISPPPAIFCTAHTHHPFICELDNTVILNIGSVGQPCDGDVRASYGRIVWENGRFTTIVRRVAYDREAAKRDFFQTDYFSGCGPTGWLIYEEWRTAELFVTPWRQRYETAVLNGEIDIETAVTTFLQERGTAVPVC